MYLFLFAILLMSLNSTFSIFLKSDLSLSTDIFSWFTDPDLIDTIIFLKLSSSDISLTSLADDFTDIFSPSSFSADNSGIENDG